MNSSFDIPIIEEHLLKICKNRMFEKSPRNVRLLNFLVQQAIKGNDVSEYIVGLELFEKKYNPDTNDSKVRVYMYNLRKKLKEYYLNEGKDDELIFILEKGQYNLKFEHKSNRTNPKLTNSSISKISQIVFNKKILLSIIGFFILLIALWFSNNVFKNDLYCWNDFFKSSSNICVVADQTIVYKIIDSKRTVTINQYINNKSDYIKYIEKHPNDSIKLTDYTLFSKMAPFSVKKLTEWFLKNDSDFSLRLESNFEIDEIRTSNLLYIGQYKTMGTSRSIFLKDSKIFKNNTNINRFVVSKGNKEITYKPILKEDSMSEHALVSYMQLENGKKALFFVSNNDIGVMATVNNFMNKKWLANFYKNLPANKKFFNALFEVKGANRTEIDCKLIELEVLN